MEFIETGIDGLIEIVPDIYRDDRGYFMESYSYNKFAENGIDIAFVQDNHSYSKKNVLRGLHFQEPPHAQAKLLRVIRGKIIDVAVDIRKTSPTYGQHRKFELDGEKNHMVLIPKGFAHGFLTLEEETVIHYKCSAHYHGVSENGLKWDDPALNIDWGIKKPLLSERDQQWESFELYDEKDIKW